MLIVPEVPHMSDLATNYLRKRFTEIKVFLEYGAGGSTVLAAKMGVGYCYSVESDSLFAAAVQNKISNLDRTGITKFIVPDIGPVGEWGYPKDFSQCQKWHAYALYVWELIHKNKRMPELVLIDGRFRISCFLISVINLPAGCPIMFDDYRKRGARYDVVEEIIKPDDFFGDSALFHVPSSLDREHCYLLLAKNIVNKY